MNFLICLFLLISWQEPPDSVRFGVVWDAPTDLNSAKKELFYFQKAGFRNLMIQGIVPLDIIDLIDMYDFDVLVNLPNRFLTNSNFKEDSHFLEAQIFDFYYYYKPYKSVKGIGLFKYGQVYNENYVDKIIRSKEKTSSSVDIPFYYLHEQSPNDLLVNSSLQRYIIYNENDLRNSLIEKPFSGLIYTPSSGDISAKEFQQLVYIAQEKPVFFSSELVFSDSAQVDLKTWMNQFLKDSGTLLPLKNVEIQEDQPTYLIVIFLGCLLVFGLQFFIEPNFRKSVSRYYFAHGFFANDILDNRVRFSISSVIILLTQAVLAGMISMLIFKHILTPLGLQALSEHLSYFKLWVPNIITQFSFGFIHFILITLLQILWLYFAFKDFKSPFQAAPLILWPQLLNLIVAIVLVNAFLNSLSGLWIIIFSLIYITVLIGSFFLACKDAFMAGKRVTFLDHFKSTLPYLILLVFMFGYFFYKTGLYDYLGLAYRLR